MSKPSQKASKVPLGCQGCNPCIQGRHGSGIPCNCRFCDECLEKLKCSHGVPHGAFFCTYGFDKSWCRACYDSGERSYIGGGYKEYHVSLNLELEANEKRRQEKKAARKAEREARQERACKKIALQAASDLTAGSASSSSGQ